MSSITQDLAPALPMRRYASDAHPSLLEECRDVAAHGHLLFNLVYRDLTVRYKRSVIGFFWTMLNPLLLMVIFVVIFSTLFRFQLPHYETYFLSAFLPWTFFSQTTVNAMMSMNWNGALMKRVRVPKSIFALANVLSGLVNLVLSYVPLVLIMLILRFPVRPAIVFLPVSFVILAVFTLGVSLVFSAVSVYFVDVREMYAVLLTGVMYMCPIVYPASIVPLRFQRFIRLNPLVYLLQVVRDPVYNGKLPAARDVMIAVIAAIGALVVGWSVFRKLSRGFYPHL